MAWRLRGGKYMRKKSKIIASSLIALSLFAAACGSDDEASDGIIAGVAFDTGGRGDGTFNDSAATGGDQAASELGADVQELEATVDEDRKANLELLAGRLDVEGDRSLFGLFRTRISGFTPRRALF